MSQSFDAFWQGVDDELARYPVSVEMTPVPARSTESSTSYAVRLTSAGPYRISGFYSVPNAVSSGKVPGLLITPRYGSVNNPPDYYDRERYAVFQVHHRGQRLADRPFAAAYPGLLTLGIDSPETWIYRGIVADCLRAAEFLRAQPGLDGERLGIQGDDLALLTAARRPGFTAILASDLHLYRLLEAADLSDAYPVEEVNDHLRTHPASRAAVADTLGYFDPVHHVSALPSITMLSDGNSDEAWLRPLRLAIGSACETYRLTHKGSVDHDYLDAWLAGQLGAPARSRFRERV